MNFINLKKLIQNIFKFFFRKTEPKLSKWVVDNGDKTMRLNYELNKNSVVVDVGGFEGQWASDIFNKYCCTVHIFEPVEEFALKIKERFSNNQKIFSYSVGLGGSDRMKNISFFGDQSSTIKSNVFKKTCSK